MKYLYYSCALVYLLKIHFRGQCQNIAKYASAKKESHLTNVYCDCVCATAGCLGYCFLLVFFFFLKGINSSKNTQAVDIKSYVEQKFYQKGVWDSRTEAVRRECGNTTPKTMALWSNT